MTTNPHAPAGLGTAGAALWQAILSDVADGYELDRRELTLLERACTTADHLSALEEVVAAEGPTTTGSRGQTVVHPALAESRQQKLVLLRLLSAIDLGPEDGETTPASRRARHAAAARWGREAHWQRRKAEAQAKEA